VVSHGTLGLEPPHVVKMELEIDELKKNASDVTDVKVPYVIC